MASKSSPNNDIEVIDLTKEDEDEDQRVPNQGCWDIVEVTTNPRNKHTTACRRCSQALLFMPHLPNKHPAPLQGAPQVSIPLPIHDLKLRPPQPLLRIGRFATIATGNFDAKIMLIWNMNLSSNIAEIAKYQLYKLRKANGLWERIGEMEALPLPMACTLNQFTLGQKYDIILRAVDVHGRFGPFSQAVSFMFQ